MGILILACCVPGRCHVTSPVLPRDGLAPPLLRASKDTVLSPASSMRGNSGPYPKLRLQAQIDLGLKRAVLQLCGPESVTWLL